MGSSVEGALHRCVAHARVQRGCDGDGILRNLYPPGDIFLFAAILGKIVPGHLPGNHNERVGVHSLRDKVLPDADGGAGDLLVPSGVVHRGALLVHREFDEGGK